MRISNLGSVPTVQSRQPSQDRVVIRSSSNKDRAEQTSSAVELKKSDAAGDTGHGQVEAYRALERHAPVERRPEAAFQRLDLNGDGALSAAELEANSANISEVLNRRVTPEQLLRELDVDADGELGQGEVKGLERRHASAEPPAEVANDDAKGSHLDRLV